MTDQKQKDLALASDIVCVERAIDQTILHRNELLETLMAAIQSRVDAIYLAEKLEEEFDECLQGLRDLIDLRNRLEARDEQTLL